MASVPPSVASCQDFTLPNIPELYNPNFLDALLPPSTKPRTLKNKESLSNAPTPKPKPTGPSNPMMSALQASAEEKSTENGPRTYASVLKSNRGFTANGAPTYVKTKSATLDAFQNINHKVGRDLSLLLTKSWEEDPELTLKIIWNLRSIHEGKGLKDNTYRAFGWLYANHPRTAIYNLRFLVEPACSHRKEENVLSHGYWKDLLNILALETVDQLVGIPGSLKYLHCPRQKYTYPNWNKKKGTREWRIAKGKKHTERAQRMAKEARAKRAGKDHTQLDRKLHNTKYQALYIAIARLFAERLVKDLNILIESETLPPDVDRIAFLKQLSLAGKWAPTPKLSHDRITNISTAIILLIRDAQALPFPSILSNPQATLSDRERVAVLRSFYQRWILTPLRKVLAIPEVAMSANRWTEIKYNRVPSQCMQLHQDHFLEHDREGFENYLIRVEQGKSKISGATLMPHELVARAVAIGGREEGFYRQDGMTKMEEARKASAEARMRVLGGQWKSLIGNLRESGTLENAIAVCDVSGSMGSLCEKLNKEQPQPIFPAVALSLVLAQLAKPPFSNGFITFSASPEFVVLDPELSLYDTLMQISLASWGMNTNLNAVFLDLILPLAVKHQIKQEDMIKRVFIFSDMQFDAAAGTRATSNEWKTNHDAIEEAYRNAGYEVPQIVYWDLAAYGTTPVEDENKSGVALMNGFSPMMLKVFMGELDVDELVDEWEEVGEDGESKLVKMQEEFTPIAVMKKALGGKSYAGLKVVD